MTTAVEEPRCDSQAGAISGGPAAQAQMWLRFIAAAAPWSEKLLGQGPPPGPSIALAGKMITEARSRSRALVFHSLPAVAGEQDVRDGLCPRHVPWRHLAVTSSGRCGKFGFYLALTLQQLCQIVSFMRYAMSSLSAPKKGAQHGGHSALFQLPQSLQRAAFLPGRSSPSAA